MPFTGGESVQVSVRRGGVLRSLTIPTRDAQPHVFSVWPPPSGSLFMCNLLACSWWQRRPLFSGRRWRKWKRVDGRGVTRRDRNQTRCGVGNEARRMKAAKSRGIIRGENIIVAVLGGSLCRANRIDRGWEGGGFVASGRIDSSRLRSRSRDESGRSA